MSCFVASCYVASRFVALFYVGMLQFLSVSSVSLDVHTWLDTSIFLHLCLSLYVPRWCSVSISGMGWEVNVYCLLIEVRTGRLRIVFSFLSMFALYIV